MAQTTDLTGVDLIFCRRHFSSHSAEIMRDAFKQRYPEAFLGANNLFSYESNACLVDFKSLDGTAYTDFYEIAARHPNVFIMNVALETPDDVVRFTQLIDVFCETGTRLYLHYLGTNQLNYLPERTISRLRHLGLLPNKKG